MIRGYRQPPALCWDLKGHRSCLHTYHLGVLSYDSLHREVSLSSKPVCVSLPTTDPFSGRVDAVPSKAELTFLPGLFGQCHHPGSLEPHQLKAFKAALPTVLPRKPSFPTPQAPQPSPQLCWRPGGVPRVPGAGWGTVLTGSRGAKAGQPASPPPSALLRAPSSLSCGIQRAEIAPKTRAAFRGAMPGAGQPGVLPSPGVSALPRGLLPAPAALEGAPAGHSPGEEHLHLSAKITNSALEFLTWQQSPRRRGWLPRVPAGGAWGGPVVLAEGPAAHL